MFNLKNCFMIRKNQPSKQERLQDYIIVNKEFENNECIICLERMNIGEKIKILNCGHMYHNECINEWFKRKRECPLCFK